MKTKEIADWMSISYDCYRHSAAAKLKILQQYCAFTKYHGGVEITEIYIPCFLGDLEKTKDVENYLQCIKSKKDGLSSVKGMTREFAHKKKEGYENMSLKAIEYRLTRAGEQAFGKNRTLTNPDSQSNMGAYGYRNLVWAIKVSDYNEYRYPTEEETARFHEIITAVLAKDPEKQAKRMLLEEEFKTSTSMTKETYLEIRERLELDQEFSECVKRFYEETGLIIVHCSQHVLKNQKGAF